MAGGRRPLFDLMTDPSRNPRPGPAPSSAPAPQPAPPTPSPLSSQPAPRQAAQPPRAIAAVETKPIARPTAASHSAAAGALASAPTRAHANPHSSPHSSPHLSPESAQASPSPAPAGAMTVPRVWFYWGITGLVLLFVLIWWGGVNAGKQDAERRFAQQISPQLPQNPETPGDSRPSDSDATFQPQGTGPQGQETPSGGTPPTPVTPTGNIYHAGAWVGTDPRIKGMNYLHLVVLPKPDAVRAVDYLRSKGRQAVAVPSKVVDRSPDGGKNPSYFVYLLTPLSKDQYRDAATRQRVENDVKALGKEWAKGKDRGPSDFSQPGWVKYDE